jgi:hypothetical protein
MGVIATAEASLASVLSKVDVPALIAAGQSLVAAWPTIEATVAAEAAELPPLIAAIKAALSGQTPTDADWAALDAQLDAADADIAAAGAAAQAKLDSGG